MKIYVDKIPKDCSECGLCMEGQVKLQKKGRYVDAKGCVLGDFYKYRTMDDEIDTCPLEIYKGNQTAIECLKEVKADIVSMTDLSMIKETEHKTAILNFYKDIMQVINAIIDNKIKELEEEK